RHAGRRARGAAEVVGVVAAGVAARRIAARVVAGVAGAVGGPDAGRARPRVAHVGVLEVAAGERAPHGAAVVAVHAAPGGVVARPHGDHTGVAGVAVVVDALVAVAGGEADHAALAAAPVAGGVIDGQARAVGQRRVLAVDGVLLVPPGAV